MTPELLLLILMQGCKLRVTMGGKDICIVVIKDGREASHLFSHETLPFILAVQLVSVPALRLD